MRTTILTILALAVVAAGIYFWSSKSSGPAAGSTIVKEVSYGPFSIFVNATGELQAKRSTKIRGPQTMRSVGIYQTTISELIPEGTIVSKGDFIASLDKTELATKMQEVQTEIEKIQTQLEQTKIDTAIEMKEIRDEIANLQFSMEEERLEIEKNRYEPEMIIEQSKLKLEKSERDYGQLLDKLKLKQIQSEAKVGEIDANLRQQNNKLGQLSGVANQFTVFAPEDGMLIYESNWNGKKTTGSQVSAWDPVVAELPDLSDMISKIFVNEVDISKVKKGQEVSVKIDAFPDQMFPGTVNKVANIGQQLRNQDAKVFEVLVQLHEIDSLLRPAMTTSNEILVYSYEEVVSVPIEAFKKDTLAYVVRKEDGDYFRQEVVVGEANSDEIVVVAGLERGDIVCLTFPDNLPELELKYLTEEERRAAKEGLSAAAKTRAKYERENAARVNEEIASKNEGGGSRVIIF
ncbi:MAG: HlyD family secretion protein [Saprospiraceae bacterium]|nr:HlyD family secretion protein [Saprospiraceae bacterium]